MLETELGCVEGGGNVFRDCGDPQADLRQAKAIIAARIIAVLEQRKLTVRKATEVTREPGRFALDRLMKILATLDGRLRMSVQVVPTEAWAVPLPG